MNINKKIFFLFITIFLIFTFNRSIFSASNYIIEESSANLPTINGIVSENEYENNLFLDSLNEFKLSYTIENNTIYFAIEALARGWVGIGIDPDNFTSSLHRGADIYVGTSDSGQPIYKDKFGKSKYDSKTDTSEGGTNDIISADVKQNSTWTTFEFSRKLSTGDSFDKEIIPENEYSIMWAFHINKDEIDDHHSSEGIALVIFHEDTFIPPTPTPPPTNGGTNVTVDGNIFYGEYSNIVYLDSLYKYRLSYSIINETAFFGIEVPVTGWIALGIEPSNPSGGKHQGADIIMGTYDTASGSPKYSDEYGSSATNHQSDLSLGGTDDIIAFQSTENASWTTIEFSRNLTTPDNYDKNILLDTDQYIMWAYHSISDDLTQMHSARGYYLIKFVETNSSSIPTPPPPVPDPEPIPTGGVNGSIDGIINTDEYNVSFFLDSLNQYKLFYRINNDVIYIGIEAETLGWVALGFNPDDPRTTQHLGADIMIAAFDESQNTTLYSDEYGNSAMTHASDTSLGGNDDIISIAGSENATWTTIEFSRKITSSDSYDKNIVLGDDANIIWAFHSSSDDLTSYHSKRGYFIINFNLLYSDATNDGATTTNIASTSAPFTVINPITISNPLDSITTTSSTEPVNNSLDNVDNQGESSDDFAERFLSRFFEIGGIPVVIGLGMISTLFLPSIMKIIKNRRN